MSVEKLRDTLRVAIQLKTRQERNDTLRAICKAYNIYWGYDEETFTYKFTYDPEGELGILEYRNVDVCDECFFKNKRCELNPAKIHYGGCKTLFEYRISEWKDRILELEDEAK